MTSMTAPRTWATGTIGASALNTDLRDNFTALRNLNGYACRLKLDADLSLTTSVDTAITWASASYNVGAMWTAVSPTRITAPVTGYYAVAAHGSFYKDNTGYRQLSYQINGLTGAKARIRNAVNTSGTYVWFYDEVFLTAADYVEIKAMQNSGAALTLDSGVNATTCTVRLLGDANAAAWTAPRDWALGENMTLALLNAQVRDNEKNLYGLNGLACRLYRTANATLTNDANITASWQAADWNIGAMWASASADRVYCKAIGYYSIFGRAKFSTNSSGRRYVLWSRNGSNQSIFEDEMTITNASGETVLNLYTETYMSTTASYVGMVVYQNAGPVINLKGGDQYDSVFGVRLIGTTAT
jgi:hypothetical protein